MTKKTPITFTVIGGFLGAGKTNLVNRILAQGGTTRFAVMVNDFGALNIDESLITETEGKVMQLANGCICCSLAGGLVEAMINLMEYRDQIDHILIEASGVSNPSRIMDFARIDHDLHPGLTLVLADVTRLGEQLNDPRLQETLHDQLSSADIFLMTKTDLVTADAITHLRGILSTHQPRVPIINLSPDDDDLAQLLVLDPQFTGHLEHNDNDGHYHPHHHHDHSGDDISIDHGFSSIALVADKPIERMDFTRICKSFSHDILRGKGIINFTNGVEIWHQTGRYIDFSPPTAAIMTDTSKQSQMVVIALDQPEAVKAAMIKIGFTSYQSR